jgi:hypothetical protein
MTPFKYLGAAIGAIIFLIGVSVPVRVALTGLEVTVGVGVSAVGLILVGGLTVLSFTVQADDRYNP